MYFFAYKRLSNRTVNTKNIHTTVGRYRALARLKTEILVWSNGAECRASQWGIEPMEADHGLMHGWFRKSGQF